MKPEHLSLLRTPGPPSTHPGLDWAAVAIARPDLEADAYRSRIWRVPLTPGPAVALTAGPADTDPVISPDGRWIAFLRGGDEPAQLAVLDTRGGEPRVLTSHTLGVSGAPEWSPDSSRIAYTARVAEPGRYGTNDGVGPGEEPARHITSLAYRIDGTGFTLDKPAQLFVVEVPRPASPRDGDEIAPRPIRLTEGPLAVRAPVWLPDGAELLALRARHDELGGDLIRLALPAASENDDDASSASTSPEAGGGSAGRPSEAAPVPVPVTVIDLGGHGRSVDAIVLAEGEANSGAEQGSAARSGSVPVHLLLDDFGPDRLDYVGKNAALYRAVLTPRALTDLLALTDPTVHDLKGGDGVFHALPGGDVLVARTRRGRTELVRISPEGAIAVVHPGSVIGAAARPGGEVVVSAVLPDSPGEVLLVEPATLDARGDVGVTRLTDLAAGLREATGGVHPVREVSGAVAPDGYPVHGWVTLPEPQAHGEGPYPVLLVIHGGPYADFQDVFFDEVQTYAGAGYAVVFGNPRGSTGYGSAHGQAIVERFGTLDTDDVLALLDAALAAHPQLDAARVGVMGGSYGGYLTAWLTTRPEVASRFRGAIVERGFLDPASFVGSADIGWFFPDRYLGTDPAQVAAQSPMAHLDAVTTPTLVIHSEQDWRCPVEQGQRWYVGLKRRAVEAELLLFPGEGHELSRSGRPKHRLQRFEAILDWWARRL